MNIRLFSKKKGKFVFRLLAFSIPIVELIMSSSQEKIKKELLLTMKELSSSFSNFLLAVSLNRFLMKRPVSVIYITYKSSA